MTPRLLACLCMIPFFAACISHGPTNPRPPAVACDSSIRKSADGRVLNDTPPRHNDQFDECELMIQG